MEVKKGQLLRHHSGRYYRVLDICPMLIDGEQLTAVYYQGEDKHTWIRPLVEFKGKFTHVVER